MSFRRPRLLKINFSFHRSISTNNFEITFRPTFFFPLSPLSCDTMSWHRNNRNVKKLVFKRNREVHEWCWECTWKDPDGIWNISKRQCFKFLKDENHELNKIQIFTLLMNIPQIIIRPRKANLNTRSTEWKQSKPTIANTSSLTH